jgi:hypothetical protein
VNWCKSNRADKAALPLADRHYNRQKIGSSQFVPPGSCLVLLSAHGDALWVTSFPIAAYVKHAWAGAWVCSLFRNEGGDRASDLIVDAVAATRFWYGAPPEKGMITFIDQNHVRPIKVRGRSVYGWTWLKAGFCEVGRTKSGLLAFQLLPCDMPAACRPHRFMADVEQ